ncbi:MAG: dihydropteroate synthase [Gemmataceae bacterium]|nr:dihydropteroate synthase [Gemmataceae bacterium]
MQGTSFEWHLPDRVLTIGRRPLVMGIVNVTPDSFSDGGRHASADSAVAHAKSLVAQGADLLDLGGESTRPGAAPVPVEEELRRVLPVVEALASQVAIPLSVDTMKAEVARRCLAAGARIVNDVTALTGDAAMPEVVRAGNAGVVLMHMQGTPATMQRAPRYENVVLDIARFLEARLHALADVGIAAERMVLDPGIGFGKTLAHNLSLLARLGELGKIGRPVCLGVSRKGFIGRLLDNRPVAGRMAGSLAVVCRAICRGDAQILRVHDVQETRDAVTLLAAIDESREAES